MSAIDSAAFVAQVRAVLPVEIRQSAVVGFGGGELRVDWFRPADGAAWFICLGGITDEAEGIARVTSAFGDASANGMLGPRADQRDELAVAEPVAVEVAVEVIQ